MTKIKPDLAGEIRSEAWKQAPAVSRPALTSTLFVNVKNDMTIGQEEIFGPHAPRDRRRLRG